MELPLIDQTDQSQALINLPQVENDIVLVASSVVQSDDRRTLLVELQAAPHLVNTVDARHIYQHVDQLWTDLVVLHFNRVAICSNVYFADDIEKESFLYFRSVNQVIHHRADEGDLREELLNDFGESLVYGVVINRGEVEGQTDL